MVMVEKQLNARVRLRDIGLLSGMMKNSFVFLWQNIHNVFLRKTKRNRQYLRVKPFYS